MLELLQEKCRVDEEHGILTQNEIIDKLRSIFDKYGLDCCYLFGSYAKQNAGEKSDVDLLIYGEITGLRFYGLLQEITDSLHKKIDLIRLSDAVSNPELIGEIIKFGVKIYG